MSKTFVPAGDRILVRPLRAVTEGNIEDPEAKKSRPLLGVVLSIGPGFRTDQGVTLPMSYAVHDVVVYGKYSGTNVAKILNPDADDDDELLTMREEEVLGWVKDE